MECISERCSKELSSPYRPEMSISCTKRVQGRQARSFISKWFDEHKWLSFCVTQNKVYCFYCRLAVVRGSRKSETTFSSNGFNNWKKAKSKFREHENTQVHIEACRSYKALQQPSIATRLSQQKSNEQKKHRELLMKQLSSLQYLMRQGLAVRGHNEEGNLTQLLKCRSDDIPMIKEWLSDRSYMSPCVTNDK